MTANRRHCSSDNNKGNGIKTATAFDSNGCQPEAALRLLLGCAAKCNVQALQSLQKLPIMVNHS